MYKICGFNEILIHLTRVVKPYLQTNANKESLIQAYRLFLRDAQPQVPKPSCTAFSLLWQKKEIKPFLKVFKEESILDDFQDVFAPHEESQSAESIQRIQRALEEIKEINSSFAHLIELIIHTIFSAPSKLRGGGSTSAAIGCIWGDLRPHWSNQDILEFLVHETTHNLVFIDELCNQHYSNYQEIAKEENFTESAILHKLRPLDKVFHSIIVSVEVLAFREDHFGHPDSPCLHPPSPIMIEQAHYSVRRIFENHKIKNLMTDRSRALLRLCDEKLSRIEDNLLCALKT